MRSLPFKLIILIMLIIGGINAQAYAYGETDGLEMPQIQGEELFNSSVENTVSGKTSFNPADILSYLTKGFMNEIGECAKNVVILFILAAISGVLTTVSNSLGKNGASEAAFFACFTIMSAAAIKCFSAAMNYGADVVKAMTDFITKLSPLVMLTMAASGKTVSAAAFRPVLSGAVYIVSEVIEKCLMPLVAFSSVLAVAGNVSDRVQLSGFCKVVRSVAKWIMAAIMTIFTGISAIYGFSSPSLDAMSAKMARFAAGTLVPVVGSFLSDTLETVVSGTRLMKNAVGTSGIIVICVICVVPALKIGAMQLMLKIASAVAEPLTDKRISSMMWEVSESVTTVFAVVVMVAVLFLINICIMLAVT